MVPHAVAAAAARPRVEGAREAEILEATVRVLAEVGYDRLTMDQVAAEARAGKATLYRRWESKAALVVDAVSRAKGLRDPVLPDTGTLRGDLMGMLCGHGGVTERLPMSVLAGLMTALHTDPDLSRAWRDRFLAPRMAVMATVLSRARDRGEVDDDVDLDLLQTLIPSICAFHSTVLGREIDDDFVAHVIDQVVLPAAAPRTSGRSAAEDLP